MNQVATKPGAVGVLEERAVGDIAGQFFIRAYQRGYRWGDHEVTQLLDDIANNPPRSTYYLQPVVVKQMADGRWELVDGQQRLTTLYLILQYIKRAHIPSAELRYELEYATRPGSQQYLKNPDEARSGDNIDFFHIYRASECIRKWFEAHGHDQALAAIDFYRALSTRVKVIWYEAPEETDSIAVFTRLNVGRIPLTNAELVKALLLTRSKGDSAEAGRSLEIAAQWDVIERDLRSPEVWAFVDAVRSSPFPLAADALKDIQAHWLRDQEAARLYDWRYYLAKYPSSDGGSGIYYAEGGVLGYSLCMIRGGKIGIWSYYRDPYLSAIRGELEDTTGVEDPWFTGYESNPRWLRLTRSRVGVRSVSKGLELQPPVEADEAAFKIVCSEFGVNDECVLVLPQTEVNGHLVDTGDQDRVQLGVAVVRSLIEHGL